MWCILTHKRRILIGNARIFGKFNGMCARCFTLFPCFIIGGSFIIVTICNIKYKLTQWIRQINCQYPTRNRLIVTGNNHQSHTICFGYFQSKYGEYANVYLWFYHLHLIYLYQPCTHTDRENGCKIGKLFHDSCWYCVSFVFEVCWIRGQTDEIENQFWLQCCCCDAIRCGSVGGTWNSRALACLFREFKSIIVPSTQILALEILIKIECYRNVVVHCELQAYSVK